MYYTTLVKASYYAPRVKHRLMHLCMLIAQRYLRAEDRLIGVVGDAGGQVPDHPRHVSWIGSNQR